MAESSDTMMNPPIEALLDAAGSKFDLCNLAGRRARALNDYYTQGSQGLGHAIPPQVTSSASKVLSIAFEEIGAGKIIGGEVSANPGCDCGPVCECPDTCACGDTCCCTGCA